MSSAIRLSAALAFAFATPASVAHAQHTAMPAGMSHEQHTEAMKKEAAMKAHGERAMGFDQDTTIHHFGLAPEGGWIAVDVTVPDDQAERDKIRTHLKEIAVAFTQGDFNKPLMTHGEQPPGVPVLQRLKTDVVYAYEDTDKGGIVRIATANREALAAVHAFLRYQIREHAAGASR